MNYVHLLFFLSSSLVICLSCLGENCLLFSSVAVETKDDRDERVNLPEGKG